MCPWPRIQAALTDEWALNVTYRRDRGEPRTSIKKAEEREKLRRERKQRNDSTTAIVTIEQMYPFPDGELKQELHRYPGLREIIWVQEEPANMGALFFMMPLLERLGAGIPVRSVKRSASASPATGSPKAHELEQKTLLQLAFASVRS